MMSKIAQPWRGLVLAIIAAVVTALVYYVGIMPVWYDEAIKPLSWAYFPLPMLLMFGYIFVYLFFGANWPFTALPQPLSGILTSIVIFILGFVSYWIFHSVGWDGVIFPLVSIWLAVIFTLGPWSNMYLGTLIGYEQPQCLINSLITTLGLSLIILWMVPMDWMGKTGTQVPFFWFDVATFFSFALGLWPFAHAKSPALPLLGYFGVFTLVIIWFFYAIGMDPFAAPGTPAYGLASLAHLLWLLSMFIPIMLFQWWPFHKITPVLRGIVLTIVAIVVTMVIFKSIVSCGPLVTGKATTVGFALFVALWFMYGICGYAGLPPVPGTSGLPPAEPPAESK